MTEVYVAFSPFRGCFELVAFHKSAGGSAVGRPVEFEVKEDGFAVERPTMTLKPEEAQLLADRLWDAGVRAAGSKQGNGAFDAQGRHLEDMRKLVFKEGAE